MMMMMKMITTFMQLFAVNAVGSPLALLVSPKQVTVESHSPAQQTFLASYWMCSTITTTTTTTTPYPHIEKQKHQE